MRFSLFLIPALLLAFSSCDVLNHAVSTVTTEAPLTNDQMAGGIKDALKQGASKAVSLLSMKDGYFGNPGIKILFPEEAKKVENTLRSVGAGALVDNAIEKMNRSAEDAAIGSKDILVNAITSMTMSDALNILMGEPNACTNYLRRTTSDQIYQKFYPVIGSSMNKVGAATAWNEVTTRYNKVPMVEKVNTDLNDHITRKAMEGLFKKIEGEEAEIRANPLVRGTELMKKVFAKQDSNK
jgi:hypothetical protein